MNTLDANFAVTPEWVRWLEENAKLGVSCADMAAAMVADGCRPETAEALVRAFSLRKPAETKAGEPSATEANGANSDGGNARLGKVRWLLNALRTMQAGGGTGGAVAPPVAERRSIDAGEFEQHFYAPNVPVVYRAGLSPSNVAENLRWRRLEREFGERMVEVQRGRSAKSDFERQSDQLKSRERFADFLRRAEQAESSNDFYMTANNGNANRSLLEDAVDTGALCPELLDGAEAGGRVFLWIGPRGTFTPAHHDLTNNLFFQVEGQKRFRLVSSLALLEIDNDRHCYCREPLSELDHRRALRGLAPLSVVCTLEAGDVLFIPVGWWHEVEGLSASISLSATNLRCRNDFFRDYQFYGDPQS